MGNFSEENKIEFLKNFDGRYDLINGSPYGKEERKEYLRMAWALAKEAPVYKNVKLDPSDLNDVSDLILNLKKKNLIFSSKENYPIKKFVPKRFYKYYNLSVQAVSSGTTGAKEILTYIPIGPKLGQSFFDLTRSFMANQLFKNNITLKNYQKHFTQDSNLLTVTGPATPSMMPNDCSSFKDVGFGYHPSLIESRGLKNIVIDALTKLSSTNDFDEKQRIIQEIFATNQMKVYIEDYQQLLESSPNIVGLITLRGLMELMEEMRKIQYGTKDYNKNIKFLILGAAQAQEKNEITKLKKYYPNLEDIYLFFADHGIGSLSLASSQKPYHTSSYFSGVKVVDEISFESVNHGEVGKVLGFRLWPTSLGIWELGNKAISYKKNNSSGINAFNITRE